MVLDNFQLRRYEESDLDSVEQLFKTRFKANQKAKRKLIFDWIARHNPAADSETCYLVIEDDNKIAAYEGRMPVDFMINGEAQMGYFLHDLLIQPEYRKKSLGLLLNSYLQTDWEEETDTFITAIWMNEYTRSFLNRSGYHQLNAHYYLKPVRLEPVLMRIFRSKLVMRLIAPFGLSLINLYGFFSSRRQYPDISISQIDRFDQRFDMFADKISRKFPLILLRYSDYLNWEYIEKTSANYTVFTAERDGDLTGYIILLLNETESGDMKLGVIADILADPDDSQTIASLCQTAISFFKKEGIDIIQCVLTNKAFIKIFKKYLFIKRRKPALPVMSANLHKHPTPDTILDIDNWFLTLGDSDAFVWK